MAAMIFQNAATVWATLVVDVDGALFEGPDIFGGSWDACPERGCLKMHDCPGAGVAQAPREETAGYLGGRSDRRPAPDSHPIQFSRLLTVFRNAVGARLCDDCQTTYVFKTNRA